MGTEGKSGEFGDLLCSSLREFGMSVQACAHSGSADGEVVEASKYLLQPLDVSLQKTGPPAELLAKGQRHGILQVRSADLYHVVEFRRLGGDRVMNAEDGRN